MPHLTPDSQEPDMESVRSDTLPEEVGSPHSVPFVARVRTAIPQSWHWLEEMLTVRYHAMYGLAVTPPHWTASYYHHSQARCPVFSTFGRNDVITSGVARWFGSRQPLSPRFVLTATIAASCAMAGVPPAISSSVHASTQSNSANGSIESEIADFKHPISASDAATAVSNAGLEIRSVEFLVGNGFGHHVYDPELSDAENEAELSGNLEHQASGQEPAVVSAVVGPETFDGGKPVATARQFGSGSQIEDLVDAASLLPEQGSGDVDLTESRIAPSEPSQSPSALLESKAKNYDLPESRAHANSVWIQTKDNVSGKRQVIFNARWMNESNSRNSPLWWGSEFQLYQHNPSLSSTLHRPACPIGNDAKFWTNANIKGATMVFILNDGIEYDFGELETYVDFNHLTDPCSTGAIGFGVGMPRAMPDMKMKVGASGPTVHQDIYVDMRLRPGDQSRSYISAAAKFVQNNCPGKVPHTDCMGLSIDYANPWPSASLGGGTDMRLLSEDRKWQTPTHFSWDEYADKRPKPIK